MPTTVRSVLDDLSRRLRDVERRQWPVPALTSAVNAALTALCNAAPSAYTVDRQVTLAAGTSQRIPDDCNRLLEILYNVAGDSVPVTLADRGVLDSGAPGWRQDASRGHVIHYMLSDVEHRRFDVWPPVGAGGVDVYGVFSRVPIITSEDFTSETALMPVDDFYVQAIIEYALYHAYSIDDDVTANANRSNQHLNNFRQLVNLMEGGQAIVDAATPADDH